MEFALNICVSNRNLRENSKQNPDINPTVFRLRTAQSETTTNFDVDLHVIVLSLVELQDESVSYRAEHRSVLSCRFVC